MSYRLSQEDERVLVRGARRDLRGDVGVCSGSGNLEERSMYAPIKNFQPWRYWDRGLQVHHATEDVGFRCGSLVVTLKRYPSVARDMGDTIMSTSLGDRIFLTVVAAVGPIRFETLKACYCHPNPWGLETFDDVAALVATTAQATRCLKHEQAQSGAPLSMSEALGRLSRRCGPRPAPGDEASEADKDLFNAIYEEADARLSRACKAWSNALRDARRQNDINELARAG